MSYGAQLVEPGVSYFYNITLQKCHDLKTTYYNIYYNTLVLLGFCLVLWCFLYMRYKGKLNPIEQKLKQTRKQEYIMSKIRNYQDIKQQKSNANMITQLPELHNDYDIVARKLYNT